MAQIHYNVIQVDAMWSNNFYQCLWLNDNETMVLAMIDTK